MSPLHIAIDVPGPRSCVSHAALVKMKIACWFRYHCFRRNVKSSVCTCLVRLRPRTLSMTMLPAYSDGIVEKVVNDLHQQLHLERFNCFVELRHHIPYIAKTSSWIFQESSQTLRPVLKCTSDMASEKDSSHYSSLLLVFGFFFWSLRKRSFVYQYRCFIGWLHAIA